MSLCGAGLAAVQACPLALLAPSGFSRYWYQQHVAKVVHADVSFVRLSVKDR